MQETPLRFKGFRSGVLTSESPAEGSRRAFGRLTPLN